MLEYSGNSFIVTAKMTYIEFKNYYKYLIKHLLANGPDGNEEYEDALARYVYSEIKKKGIRNQDEITVLFHDVFSNTISIDETYKTRKAIERLLPKNSDHLINDDVMPFKVFLSEMESQLTALPLHKGLIGAMSVLGYKISIIAEVFNCLIAEYTSALSHDLNLKEIYHLLEEIRKYTCKSVFSSSYGNFDEHADFINSIVNYKNHPVNDVSFWEFLCEHSREKEEIRFSRVDGERVYYNGKIKSLWESIKKHNINIPCENLKTN